MSDWMCNMSDQSFLLKVTKHSAKKDKNDSFHYIVFFYLF